MSYKKTIFKHPSRHQIFDNTEGRRCKINLALRHMVMAENGQIFPTNCENGMLCLTANLIIGTYNGEMVFNRFLGNRWSDFDDFFGRPT